jgi:hypothetical protein
LAGREAGGQGGQRKCGREESFEDGHLETVQRDIGGSDRVIMLLSSGGTTIS